MQHQALANTTLQHYELLTERSAANF